MHTYQLYQQTDSYPREMLPNHLYQQMDSYLREMLSNHLQDNQILALGLVVLIINAKSALILQFVRYAMRDITRISIMELVARSILHLAMERPILVYAQVALVDIH